MRTIVKVMLLCVGIIHLLPLAGVAGAARLASLYGVVIDDPGLLLLMRHRAVLFGIVGGLAVAAAFQPYLQLTAILAGTVSVVSFLVLAWLGGAVQPMLHRIVVADVVALACLAVAAVCLYLPVWHEHGWGGN
jgi:hypothetical protein